MEKFRYRPEIDGLRALSVLGVVLYHAGFGVSGGFVGVDVFFVISGFLITGIIMKEVEGGTFTLTGFWVRRIRRILPAVSVVLLVVLIAGAFLLDPEAFKSLGRAGIAQSVMASNFYFMRDINGYFAESSELKPLLHTWSLSVEEQFYLLFPIAVLLLTRFRRKILVPSLWILFAGSLALSVATLSRYPSETFYLLPTRAWELLAGCLLALSAMRARLKGRAAEFCSALGLVMICIAMFIYTNRTPFPGARALLPVVGAVLFIAANEARLTATGRLLALKPVVFVGLISYSLYLWHWPLFSFARNCLVEVNVMTTASLVVISFAVATLSWRYVETPFRRKSMFPKKSYAFGFGAAVTAFVLGLHAVVWRADGFPARVDPKFAVMLEDMRWNGQPYDWKKGGPAPLGRRTPGDEPPDFALWGDSHALAVSQLVDDVAAEHGLRGIALLGRGDPPLTGIWLVDGDREKLAKLSEERLQLILDRGIRHVLLAGRWNVYCNGPTETELREMPKRGPRWGMITDQDGEVNSERSTATLERQLGRLLEEFEKHGVTVWILPQVPEIDNWRIARAFYLSKRFPALNRPVPIKSTSRAEHRERSANFASVLDGMANAKVHVLDPAETFFDGEDRVTTCGSRAYYMDGDHLTRAGAEHYLRPLFEEVFAEVAQQSEAAGR